MCVSVNNSIPRYLYCNGATVLKSSYPNLYNAIQDQYGIITMDISRFTLPNFNGLFLRGTGNQTINGILYTGKNIGSINSDSVKYQGAFVNGSSKNTTDVVSNVAGISTGNTTVVRDFNVSTGDVGNSSIETAPINTCVKYFIKY